MVSEKKIFLRFSYYNSMGANDSRGVANLDPRGIFSYFSHYKPMLDNDAPGAWPIWAPGTRLTGFMKGATKH